MRGGYLSLHSKQGFWGKSHQKVRPNVGQNLCHMVSLWYLLCPQKFWQFSCRAKNVTNRQKVSTIIFDAFRQFSGADTLILVIRALGNLCPRPGKPKTALYIQKSKKNRGLGIRCWDPNLSCGYQNCGLGIHRWQHHSERHSENLSKVWGGFSASSV